MVLILIIKIIINSKPFSFFLNEIYLRTDNFRIGLPFMCKLEISRMRSANLDIFRKNPLSNQLQLCKDSNNIKKLDLNVLFFMRQYLHCRYTEWKHCTILYDNYGLTTLLHELFVNYLHLNIYFYPIDNSSS